jgi:hypothetical protein
MCFGIKLFVNILLFVVQHDLNKIQTNPIKFLFFLTKLCFTVLKLGRNEASFTKKLENSKSQF